MIPVLQLIVAAVLFIGLPLALSWVFIYVYTFFRPLDQAIRMDRVREFELAGGASGLIVAWVIMYWWIQST